MRKQIDAQEFAEAMSGGGVHPWLREEYEREQERVRRQHFPHLCREAEAGDGSQSSNSGRTDAEEVELEDSLRAMRAIQDKATLSVADGERLRALADRVRELLAPKALDRKTL